MLEPIVCEFIGGPCDGSRISLLQPMDLLSIPIRASLWQNLDTGVQSATPVARVTYKFQRCGERRGRLIYQPQS